jgi:hypothetical protein
LAKVCNDLNGPGWRRRITVNRLVLGFVAMVLASIPAQIQFHHTDPLWLVFLLALSCATVLGPAWNVIAG